MLHRQLILFLLLGDENDVHLQISLQTSTLCFHEKNPDVCAIFFSIPFATASSVNSMYVVCMSRYTLMCTTTKPQCAHKRQAASYISDFRRRSHSGRRQQACETPEHAVPLLFPKYVSSSDSAYRRRTSQHKAPPLSVLDD